MGKIVSFYILSRTLRLRKEEILSISNLTSEIFLFHERRLSIFYLFYFILFALSQRNCERVTTTAGGHLLWTLGTSPTQTNVHKDQTITPGTPRPTLCDKCVGSLTSHRVMNIEVL